MSLLGSAASASLTPKEVVDLANTETRGHGVNPSDYQAPRLRYSRTIETWLVSYEPKPAGDGKTPGKGFSVRVDDKTKKTSMLEEP
jgi:hypothetical protein